MQADPTDTAGSPDPYASANHDPVKPNRSGRVGDTPQEPKDSLSNPPIAPSATPNVAGPVLGAANVTSPRMPTGQVRYAGRQPAGSDEQMNQPGADGSIQLAATTTNPDYAARMLGYDRNAFGDMRHEFKPFYRLSPSDNLISHDNGDVYSAATW